MHAAIKLILGIILVLIGLWLLVPATPMFAAIKPASWSILNWWDEFKIVLKGIIPPIVIILGVLIVWIESEELKSPVVPEPEEQPKPKEKPAKKKK